MGERRGEILEVRGNEGEGRRERGGEKGFRCEG